MYVYTVRKLQPNTEREFQAYTALLEEIGIDLAHAPRMLEPGTTNRWLYVWKSKPHAERFARELSARLHDPSWAVHELELSREELGPLAPLTILAIPVNNGMVFKMEANSQARIMQHYPNARLVGEVEMPGGGVSASDVSEDVVGLQGPVWKQVIPLLTGIPEEAIARLGGIRIITWHSEVLFERLPANLSE